MFIYIYCERPLRFYDDINCVFLMNTFKKANIFFHRGFENGSVLKVSFAADIFILINFDSMHL